MNIRIPDVVRRWANLILAAGQILVTYFAFARGTSFEQATGNGIPDPPVVPAGYAFIIWSLIYAGSLAYGIYQFRRSVATDRLLRRIGPFTAGAFFGTCAWLIAARTGHLWATVCFIVWIALCLYQAFRILWTSGPLSVIQGRLVLMPISIYAGWISVATFANSASVIKAKQWPHFLLSETGWSLAILLVAGALVTAILRRNGGNVCYAMTVTWALVGIAVRSFATLGNPTVAWSALFLAILVLSLTWVFRLNQGSRNGRLVGATAGSH